MSNALGVDVSKATLQACADPAQPSRSFANTAQGVAQLLAWAAAQPPSRVVFEASGGYEQRLLQALLAAGWPACRLNAQQVHHFAKALGQRAKSDPVDAKVLQRYGQLLAPPAHVPPAPEQAHLLQLVKRRSQLVAMRTREINRSHHAQDALADSHQRLQQALNEELKRIEALITRCLQQAAPLARRVQLLASAPGIARVTASSLCAGLPELGRYGRRAISALSGLAPLARDSGAHHGQRHIAGGRALPRVALYQATLSALRFNPPIKALYQRLKAKGKPSKVAMTACMRHLLCMLNAMVRDDRPWAYPAAMS